MAEDKGQLGLFEQPTPKAELVREVAPPAFDGSTYEPEADGARLERLLDKVRQAMSDGAWRTLEEIQIAVGAGSEAGISARLRDLRKVKHGEHTVNRRRRGAETRGLWEYQLILRQPAATEA